eukprot:366163-Chlamydomonas_euryale.AAC.5
MCAPLGDAKGSAPRTSQTANNHEQRQKTTDRSKQRAELTRSPEMGQTASALTAFSWPSSDCTCMPVSASHTRMVRSVAQLTSLQAVGLVFGHSGQHPRPPPGILPRAILGVGDASDGPKVALGLGQLLARVHLPLPHILVRRAGRQLRRRHDRGHAHTCVQGA